MDSTNTVLLVNVTTTAVGNQTAYGLNPIFDSGVAQRNVAFLRERNQFVFTPTQERSFIAPVKTRNPNPATDFLIACNFSGNFVTLP